MTSNHAVVVSDGTVVVKPELDVTDVIAQVKKIQGVMSTVMHKGEHYGTIPGTQKPTLLQPGAQKLCLTFRLDPQDEVIQATETDDLIAFTVRTTLYHIATGQRIASGIGSCNSREKRYLRRDKDGGIQPAWDLHNTILKMASKRALVAAVLRGTAASDIFTQDVEDLPKEYLDQQPQAPPRPAQRQQSAPQRPAPPPVEGQAHLVDPDDLPFESEAPPDQPADTATLRRMLQAGEAVQMDTEAITAFVKEMHNVDSPRKLTQQQAEAIIARWEAAAA